MTVGSCGSTLGERVSRATGGGATLRKRVWTGVLCCAMLFGVVFTFLATLGKRVSRATGDGSTFGKRASKATGAFGTPSKSTGDQNGAQNNTVSQKRFHFHVAAFVMRVILGVPTAN